MSNNVFYKALATVSTVGIIIIVQKVTTALMALVAISILMTILNCLPVLKHHIHNRTLQLRSVFGNTGYFGIPVSLALLPNHDLIYSIGFDLGSTLVIWTLGPMLLTESSNRFNRNRYWKKLIKAISSNPDIKGLIGPVIIQSSPWNIQITAYFGFHQKLLSF